MLATVPTLHNGPSIAENHDKEHIGSHDQSYPQETQQRGYGHHSYMYETKQRGYGHHSYIQQIQQRGHGYMIIKLITISHFNFISALKIFQKAQLAACIAYINYTKVKDIYILNFFCVLYVRCVLL